MKQEEWTDLTSQLLGACKGSAHAGAAMLLAAREPAQLIRWAARPGLMFQGIAKSREGYSFAHGLREVLRHLGLPTRAWSNDPAVIAFAYFGGERPLDSNGRGWDIHHIYDGKFPFPGKNSTLHAVKDGFHFTRAEGLVALPTSLHRFVEAERLFAWYLRHQAFIRFGYDPDAYFSRRDR